MFVVCRINYSFEYLENNENLKWSKVGMYKKCEETFYIMVLILFHHNEMSRVIFSRKNIFGIA